ncbi:MAG: hypothetical protein KAT71_03255 [Gammaproteobacteria bacterium]|nr:hypothetical protein [Gammaproteobacteria bacterium]
MNCKNISIIAIRILAVFFAIKGIGQLPFFFSNLFLLFTGKQHIIAAIVSLLLFLLISCFPLLLWILSKKIACAITNDLQELDVCRSRIIDWQILVFRGIGVYILIENFPNLIGYLLKTVEAVIKSNSLFHAPRPDFIILVTIALKLILSLIIIIKASSIKVLIKNAP